MNTFTFEFSFKTQLIFTVLKKIVFLYFCISQEKTKNTEGYEVVIINLENMSNNVLKMPLGMAYR